MTRKAALPDHLFVYGSLRDAEIFEAVAGLPLALFRTEAARLPGARLLRVAGEDYPALGPGHGAAEGLLISGLADEPWRRILHYEDSDYDLREVVVLAGQALMRRTAETFWPRPTLELTQDDWSFEEWQNKSHMLLLKAARAHMALLSQSGEIGLDRACADIKSGKA